MHPPAGPLTTVLPRKWLNKRLGPERTCACLAVQLQGLLVEVCTGVPYCGCSFSSSFWGVSKLVANFGRPPPFVQRVKREQFLTSAGDLVPTSDMEKILACATWRGKLLRRACVCVCGWSWYPFWLVTKRTTGTHQPFIQPLQAGFPTHCFRNPEPFLVPHTRGLLLLPGFDPSGV